MPHATLTTDDGVRLHYEETGAGTPLVLVHEFGGDLRSWSRRCATSRACIAASATTRALSAFRVPEDWNRYSQERARRRHPQRARRPEARARARCGLSMAPSLRCILECTIRPRALHHRRWRRIWLASGAHKQFQEDSRANASASGATAWRSSSPPTASARSACSSRSRTALLRRIPRAVQRACALGAANTLLGVQCRGRLLRPARAPAEDDVPTLLMLAMRKSRRSRRTSSSSAPFRRRGSPYFEERPRHQSGGAGALQPAPRELSPPGGNRPLAPARSALDGAFALRARRPAVSCSSRNAARRAGSCSTSRRRRTRSAAPCGGPSRRRWRSSTAIPRFVASLSRRGQRGVRGGRRHLGVRERALGARAVAEYDDLLDRVLHSIQDSLKPRSP